MVRGIRKLIFVPVSILALTSGEYITRQSGSKQGQNAMHSLSAQGFDAQEGVQIHHRGSRMVPALSRERIKTQSVNLAEKVLELRGGAKAAKVHGLKTKKKKSPLKAAKETFNGVRPVTRMYLSLILFTTVVHCIGLPAPELFSLNMASIMQVWRFFTSVAYLGGPSMSMANNAYFLVRYGQELENTSGPGAHAWFLLVQTMIIGVLSLLLGFPFGAQAMIAAIIYVSSHQNPMERMPFQFGFMITSWQLPYCMAVMDCLSQQSGAALWPHVLGILSGHTYQFFTRIWPELGGKAWLDTPKFMFKLFGGKPRSNVSGLDFRATGEERSGAGSKKKARRKGKGRKLGA